MSSVLRLDAVGVSKSFGANRALHDMALAIAPGEIHGLVGQNGSGKSTFAKILSGFHTPDAGHLSIDGTELRLPTRPAELRRTGVAVVHQDLGLVDRYTVVENMRIGTFSVSPLTRAIRWREEREVAHAAITDLGYDIDPAARVGDLPAAERAAVAIARALQHQQPGQGLVMFDESTRALPREALEHFYDLVRQIAARGGSVLLVSHHLDEVLALADRVTVLRDGIVAGAGIETRQLDEPQLIELMLGRTLDTGFRPAPPRTPVSPAGQSRVRAAAVQGTLVYGIDFELSAGEVVGVTGLVGSGYEELPYLLAGAGRAFGGTLTVGARGPLQLAGATPRDALKAGIALVPERRGEDGLALSLSVAKNVTLPQVARRGSPVRIGTSWQRYEAWSVIEELDVRPPDADYRVGALSGGNQQKVLLGKWLRSRPALLLLHEPTQGVDVGARHDLQVAIERTAGEGTAVLMACLDPAELAATCDRILVMRDGRIATQLGADATADDIVLAVYGESSRAILDHAGEV